jgi:cytochrome P450
MELGSLPLLGLLVSLIFLLLVKHVVSICTCSAPGKRLPPGPWKLPLLGSLHHVLLSRYGDLPHRALRELSGIHGPLMLLRLGEIDFVVASSASAAMEVLKTHDAMLASRPRTSTTKAMTRHGLGIVLAPKGEHWRQVRKLCVNELLSARKVQSFRGIREAEAGKLVASLAVASAASRHRQPVNVSSHLATYVSNAAVRAMVGDEITDRDAFFECLDKGVTAAAGFSLTDLFPSSRLAHAFCGTTRRLEAALQGMRHVMNGVIEEHRARRSVDACNGDENILDVLLRIQQTEQGAPLNMGTVRAMITVRKPQLNCSDPELNNLAYLGKIYTHCRTSSVAGARPRRRLSNGPWQK